MNMMYVFVLVVVKYMKYVFMIYISWDTEETDPEMQVLLFFYKKQCGPKIWGQ
jgi:hypothetical protein